MPSSDPTADTADATTRRDLSVARVIDPARERAETRVQRFLDAAFDLMASTGKDFTLQEVVERSGLSLRSFYQYFNGKHELLLALLEDSVRRNEEQLRAVLAEHDSPLDRLHSMVVSYYLICRHTSADAAPAAGAAKVRVPALAEFAQQLLSDHPQEAVAALAPLLTLCEQLLADAVAAGVVRSDLRIRRTAGFVMQTVMFNAFVDRTLSEARSKDGESAAAEEAWLLLFRGIGAASG
jgi:AcrR family transcriptional regulator